MSFKEKIPVEMPQSDDVDADETADWLESLEGTIKTHGPERAAYLLAQLQRKAQALGAKLPFEANTPYVNTILVSQQPDYPGDVALEQKIRALLRSNAMAMVVRANKH